MRLYTLQTTAFPGRRSIFLLFDLCNDVAANLW